jgi:hypothetical protein
MLSISLVFEKNSLSLFNKRLRQYHAKALKSFISDGDTQSKFCGLGQAGFPRLVPSVARTAVSI